MTRNHNSSTAPTEAQQALARAARDAQDVEERWPHIRSLVRDLQVSQRSNHFSQTIDEAYKERFR